jgi:NAD(P)-dependent dehydrogenase (short-subunit alcohol dehydrogenase family)
VSYVGHGRLGGRAALITGADSGIGRAVALCFAKEGADIFFTHLPEEQGDAEETQAALPRMKPGGVILNCCSIESYEPNVTPAEHRSRVRLNQEVADWV